MAEFEVTKVTKVSDLIAAPVEGGVYKAPTIYPSKTLDNYKPEDDLVDSRTMRGAIVSALTSEGIPIADKDQMKLLLATLKDQDSAAISVIRTKVEAGGVDAMQELRDQTRVMIDMIRDNSSTAVPRRKTQEADVVDVPVLDIKTLPNDEQQEFVEGQLSVGTSTMRFDDFVRIHGDVKLAEEETPDE